MEKYKGSFRLFTVAMAMLFSQFAVIAWGASPNDLSGTARFNTNPSSHTVMIYTVFGDYEQIEMEDGKSLADAGKEDLLPDPPDERPGDDAEWVCWATDIKRKKLPNEIILDYIKYTPETPIYDDVEIFPLWTYTFQLQYTPSSPPINVTVQAGETFTLESNPIYPYTVTGPGENDILELSYEFSGWYQKDSQQDSDDTLTATGYAFTAEKQNQFVTAKWNQETGSQYEITIRPHPDDPINKEFTVKNIAEGSAILNFPPWDLPGHSGLEWHYQDSSTKEDFGLWEPGPEGFRINRDFTFYPVYNEVENCTVNYYKWYGNENDPQLLKQAAVPWGSPLQKPDISIADFDRTVSENGQTVRLHYHFTGEWSTTASSNDIWIFENSFAEPDKVTSSHVDLYAVYNITRSDESVSHPEPGDGDQSSSGSESGPDDENSSSSGSESRPDDGNNSSSAPESKPENGNQSASGTGLGSKSMAHSGSGKSSHSSGQSILNSGSFNGSNILLNHLGSVEKEAASRQFQSASASYDLSNFDGILPFSSMEQAILQNAEQDVVLISNGFTYRFAQGTMQEIPGKTSYDFGASFDTGEIHDRIYDLAGNAVVLAVHYNYDGQLPAEAEITIHVGAEYAGQTLYYYYFNRNTDMLEYMQAANVDSNGDVTVSQSHCSDYAFLSVNLFADETSAIQQNISPNNIKHRTLPHAGTAFPVVLPVFTFTSLGLAVLFFYLFCKKNNLKK